ncbi:heavy-metal-associated domain-containing protein [Pararhodospirillum photometricum]|nr:heavy-metal-associated domain-containing protein [Pararhodospirillum photometricum]
MPSSDTASRLEDLTSLMVSLRSHVTIAHHILGRVRLKIGLGALGVVAGRDQGKARFSLTDLSTFVGIESVRLNSAAQSAIVTYDPAVIPEAFWRECLSVPEDQLGPLIAATLRMRAP